jgi:hypothetical protein
MKFLITLSVLLSFSTFARDCHRQASAEARAVFGARAEVKASMSEGLGDDHFVILYRAEIQGRTVGSIQCESYNNVCNCRAND